MRGDSLLGRIVLGWEDLRVETMSVARADELRRALEQASGGTLKHRIRDHSDPTALLGQGPAPERGERVESPEVLAVEREWQKGRS